MQLKFTHNFMWQFLLLCRNDLDLDSEGSGSGIFGFSTISRVSHLGYPSSHTIFSTHVPAVFSTGRP